jgi:energy-coupling factor transporter transmembrane protein EcfT
MMPRGSAWFGAGPLSVLLGCVLPLVGAVAVDTTARGGVLLAAEIVLLAPYVRSWRFALRRGLFGLLASSSIGVSTYLYGGHHLGTTIGAVLRVLCIVAPSALLTGLIRPSELGDHLAQRAHLPARLVVSSTAALQRLDALGGQWQQIQAARRARGLGIDGGLVRRVRTLAASAFTLLVVALRQSSVLAVAMDVRGFANAHDRTWAEPAPWRRGDSLLAAFAMALAIGPWLFRSLA